MADEKIRPMFIVKPGMMSRRDINRAEKMAGVIVVECSEPEAARYSEAPLGASLDVQARAALDLMRWLIRNDVSSFPKSSITQFLLNALIEHSGPARVPSTQSVKK